MIEALLDLQKKLPIKTNLTLLMAKTIRATNNFENFFSTLNLTNVFGKKIELNSFQKESYQLFSLMKNEFFFHSPRQTGKTVFLNAMALNKACFYKQKIVIITATKLGAKCSFDKIKKMLTGEFSEICDFINPVTSITKNHIKFENGGEIFIIDSGSVDFKLRGMTFDIALLDEFEFFNSKQTIIKTVKISSKMIFGLSSMLE